MKFSEIEFSVTGDNIHSNPPPTVTAQRLYYDHLQRATTQMCKVKVDCVRMCLNQAVSKDGTGRPIMYYFGLPR